MMLQVGSRWQPTATDASRCEHSIVGSDPAVGTGQPSQHVGLRGPTKTVGSARFQLVRASIGEDERMARELDHRVMVTGHRSQHLDGTIGRGESTLGSGDQGAVKFVHELRDYGPITCAST